jgi:hypothetical protein
VFSHAFSLVLQSTCLMWVQIWVGNVPKKNIINKIAAIDVARLPAKQLRLLEAFEGQSLQEVLKHLERLQ